MQIKVREREREHIVPVFSQSLRLLTWIKQTKKKKKHYGPTLALSSLCTSLRIDTICLLILGLLSLHGRAPAFKSRAAAVAEAWADRGSTGTIGSVSRPAGLLAGCRPDCVVWARLAWVHVLTRARARAALPWGLESARLPTGGGWRGLSVAGLRLILGPSVRKAFKCPHLAPCSKL